MCIIIIIIVISFFVFSEPTVLVVRDDATGVPVITRRLPPWLYLDRRNNLTAPPLPAVVVVVFFGPRAQKKINK